MENNLYLEKTPPANELSPFYVDPAMPLHFPPEVTPFPRCQDVTLLSYLDAPGLEHYYSSLYSFPPPPSGQKYQSADGYYEPSYIRKRNERERQRVKCVNEGYAKLRRHLPPEYLERRLSKVQTLRAAIRHICHLQGALQWDDAEGPRDASPQRGKETDADNRQR